MNRGSSTSLRGAWFIFLSGRFSLFFVSMRILCALSSISFASLCILHIPVSLAAKKLPEFEPMHRRTILHVGPPLVVLSPPRQLVSIFFDWELLTDDEREDMRKKMERMSPWLMRIEVLCAPCAPLESRGGRSRSLLLICSMIGLWREGLPPT